MSSKQLIVFLFAIILATTNSRIMLMSKTGYYLNSGRIKSERKYLIQKYNDLSNKFDKLKEFVTFNNCPIGHEFNNSMIDTLTVKCDKCPNNYYRTKYNSTCLHCPEGFVSKIGNGLCKKGKKEELINTKYCPKGSIIGNDHYAIYGESCIICNNLKKEYMSNKNIEDKCLICPNGSVVKDNLCIKCSIGYYEKDNKCIECDIGTYNNIEGSIICNKCNNTKSNSYYSIGGNNCDDNYLFYIKFLQIVSSIIYNTRKMLEVTSSSLTLMTGFIVTRYIILASS